MTNDNNLTRMENIKKTIQHLSQTTEYKVRSLLTKMGYVSDPLYYKDEDPIKNIEVIRELDFISVKHASEYYQVKRFFRKKNKRISYSIALLGDVKYYPEGELTIVGLLDPSLGSKGNGGSFSAHLSFKYSKPELLLQKKIRKFTDPNLPTCHQLIFFDQHGRLIENKNKKLKIRSICEQISSGFLVKKQEQFHTILIPLLVFGSEIKFIVGFPNDITKERFQSPNGICYRFAPSKPSDILTLPIIITSIDHLQSVINSIEIYLETFYEFKLINTVQLLHTLNIH